jgi:hypothetical protein
MSIVVVSTIGLSFAKSALICMMVVMTMAMTVGTTTTVYGQTFLSPPTTTTAILCENCKSKVKLKKLPAEGDYNPLRIECPRYHKVSYIVRVEVVEKKRKMDEED